MATYTAIAANLFESVGLVRPYFEVMVREPVECTVEREPLRMHWVREVDANGRKVLRIQWSVDKQREERTSRVSRSN